MEVFSEWDSKLVTPDPAPKVAKCIVNGLAKKGFSVFCYFQLILTDEKEKGW